jgi:8-oxo-dGTP pyrophosphatase MutT (NUDIX family)
LAEAVIREIKEETGITEDKLCRPPYVNADNDFVEAPNAVPVAMKLINVDDSFVASGQWIHHFYLIKVRNEELPENPEPDKHGDWEWHSIPDARRLSPLMPGMDRAFFLLLSEVAE